MKKIANYSNIREIISKANDADFSRIKTEGRYFPENIVEVIDAHIAVNYTEGCGLEAIKPPCPVIAPYLYKGSAALCAVTGLSADEIEDIVRARRGVMFADCGYKTVSSEDFFNLLGEGKEVYTGAEAISKILDGIDLKELEYQLSRDALNGGDSSLGERKRIVAELNARGIAVSDFLLDGIPVLPLVTGYCEEGNAQFFESAICYHTYRIWQICGRIPRFKAKEGVPPLVIINEQRMLQQHVERLFAAFERVKVTFF